MGDLGGKPTIFGNPQLVVEPTHLKNMLVKLDHFPKDRGENKELFETTSQ